MATCKNCLVSKSNLNISEEHVEKCRRWLENCTTSDGESTCTTISSSESKCTDETSSTSDDLCYNSDGLAIVDKIHTNNEINIHEDELEQYITQTQNVYQNVKINKSKKVHLGNVTYINGPVYINKTKNVVNEVSVVNNIVVPTNGVRFIDRKNWLAQPALEEYDNLKDPAKYVIVCHSATEDATSNAENILLVRLIQQFHIESRKYADIAYNFLIGNDGNTYYGRGWGKVGAHTFGYNRTSMAIGFVGCFTKKLPSEAALRQAKWLIEYGVESGAIDENYFLIGHCQCISTESPGGALFEEIKTWKNYNATINIDKPANLLN